MNKGFKFNSLFFDKKIVVLYSGRPEKYLGIMSPSKNSILNVLYKIDNLL